MELAIELLIRMKAAAGADRQPKSNAVFMASLIGNQK